MKPIRDWHELAWPSASEAELSTQAIAGWIEGRGYESVGSSHVTLYDYDTEPGLRFDGDYASNDPLADACAWADKFMREVPSPDDVGTEESERICEKWLDENGIYAPKGFATNGDVTSAGQGAEE